jgi:two-component system, NtrC family, response regulator AtoC
LLRILVVDPDPASRDAIRRAFAEAGGQVRSVGALSEGERHRRDFLPEVVVTALDFADGGGETFLAASLAEDPRRAIYALVGCGELDRAVAAMECGAHDFLWRPVSPARVSLLLTRLAARRERETRTESERLRLARAETASTLVGRAERWQAALAALERCAASDDAVLVTGEAGTEKDLAARALHRLSARGSEPFVVSDGEDLAAAAAGAGSGTLLLRGIDRLSAPLQSDVLARIESGHAPRLVVTTDADPSSSSRSGGPLSVLVARLPVVHLPPLRERGEDVLLLARHLLEEIDETLYFDAEAMEALAAHDWPGNVRELKEVVRRAARLAEGPAIGPTVVRSVLGRPLARRRRAPVVRIAVGDSLADVERRLILKTLEFARGNKRKTAELLKLSLKTIYNKIKEYGLERS